METIEFRTALEAWQAYLESLPKTASGKPLLPFDPKRYDGYETVASAHRAAGILGCCPQCGARPGERGFIRFDWPIGHVYFGRAVKCPRCWG